jgi:phosphatidylglycerol:prolipoprotein diacylglycerol transferase
MKLFPDFKTVLSFGSISVTWYAVFILSGAVLAYVFSIKTLKKWGYQTKLFEDFFFYMLPIGIVGARIYYCLFEWEFYVSDPIRVFYI